MISSQLISSASNVEAPTKTYTLNTVDVTPKTTPTSTQEQKHLRNTQVLEASLQVSIQTGNESLALLYRAAVDEINTVLEPDLGPNAIQNAIPQDNSPEATAGRIVSLSLAMFNSFAARHPDKDLAQVAKDFVNKVQGGFEQGYQEAQNILNKLGVLPDVTAVADGIARTHELVLKGYDDWLNNQLTAQQVGVPQQ